MAAAGSIPLGGSCDPRFAPVRDAFAENFASRGDLGAALCVTVAGGTVVDLWGGFTGPSRRWEWGPDTLVNVFSVGKGLVAAIAARLAGDGLLDVESPVARWWPEFGAAAKGDVTVADVLSHRAGLPAVRRLLPPTAMLDWALMTGALAAEEPWWPPGTAHGYHVNTFGFLVGEIVRRVTGKTIGSVLRDEIALPLGADVHIGFPSREDRRVAEFVGADATPPPEPAQPTEEQLLQHRTYFNPPGLSGLGTVNTRAWRAAEIPSTNAHATARGVARFYAALAAGGALDGVQVAGADALAAATTEHADGIDRVLGRPSRFGLGFQLTQPDRPLGPGPRAFGHFGAGGSLGFCDPDSEVAFGYVVNQMGPRWQNPSNRALIEAVFAALA